MWHAHGAERGARRARSPPAHPHEASVRIPSAQARLVCGNTEVGIETKVRGQAVPVLIAATHVPELLLLARAPGAQNVLRVGASVTLTRLEEALRAELAACAAPVARRALAPYDALLDQLRWFAGRQARALHHPARFPYSSYTYHVRILHASRTHPVRIPYASRTHNVL